MAQITFSPSSAGSAWTYEVVFLQRLGALLGESGWTFSRDRRRLNPRVEFERRHLGGDRPGDWRERQDRRPLPGRQAGGSSEPAL